MKPTRLTYRKIPQSFWEACGFASCQWPQWIIDLAGKSGVYVIRHADSGRVLYVGESHTGRLKKTLLRHFQHWTGKTAGNTYSRDQVEIAIVTSGETRALALQNGYIRRLSPRDNRQSKTKDDDPF